MHKFRKLPVEIEAFQVTPESRASREGWPQWLRDAHLNDAGREAGAAVYPVEHPLSDGTDKFKIVTLEGEMLVEWGDWIIQGVNGELYPCKPDIFAKTYEPA
ncbi:hypothetical protein DAH66_12720 [Sphingomonas koreensis]|uniref:Uncharacterized protein n=1 Tax=Sphingomonas koreensis TaxID=93064 RepID=A0A430G2C9_9SPHN|nr:hypothetical protein [Sphingomonas koreensis]RSY83126.1 hypothetical protein DAH66_12720 [Sphingomonas koreensis]